MGSNVPTIITERILAQLEKGEVPWHKSWKSIGLPKNLISKQPYHGINVLLLAMMSYGSPWWMTYKQARELGGGVKHGEHGVPVVFYKSVEVDNMDPTDKRDTVTIPFLRYYTVFNAEQCEGLESKIPVLPSNPNEPISECRAIVEGYETCPPIRTNGGRACYSHKEDYIGMPDIKFFDSSEDYYSTLFHEMVHSTGHFSRTDRKSMKDWSPMGTEDYSQEELVAEIGALFLMNRAGISKTFDNSLAYIQHWSKALKSDPSMIIRASSWAQKAHDFIVREGKYSKGEITHENS